MRRVLGFMCVALVMCVGTAWAGISKTDFNTGARPAPLGFEGDVLVVDNLYGGFMTHSVTANGWLEGTSSAAGNNYSPVLMHQGGATYLPGDIYIEATIPDFDQWAANVLDLDYQCITMGNVTTLPILRFMGIIMYLGDAYWVGMDSGLANLVLGPTLAAGTTRVTWRIQARVGAVHPTPGTVEFLAVYDDQASDVYQADEADFVLELVDDGLAAASLLQGVALTAGFNANPMASPGAAYFGHSPVHPLTTHLDNFIVYGPTLPDFGVTNQPLDRNGDLDADGLGNAAEDTNLNGVYDAGTDVSDLMTADTDGDGINDGDEVNIYLTDPAVDDLATADTDGDGLLNVDEVDTYGTDPGDPDSDADGLNDGDELNMYNTDPLDDDTDSDALGDGAEIAAGTDPLDPDTDSDGVQDGADAFPLNPDEDTDADADGIGDNYEEEWFPGDPTQLTATGDYDGDQVSDVDEFLGGTDPTDPTTAPGLATLWPVSAALLVALLIGVALMNVRRAHAR